MQDSQIILWLAADLLSTTIGGRELQLTQDQGSHKFHQSWGHKTKVQEKEGRSWKGPKSPLLSAKALCKRPLTSWSFSFSRVL